jgi:hypothetical protein
LEGRVRWLVWRSPGVRADAKGRGDEEVNALYSATFYAAGTYNGQDQVPKLTNAAGQPAAPLGGVGIEPWEPVSIGVACVDIVVFENATDLNYAFAGNSYSPDVMRWLGLPNPIPAGASFPFPARDPAATAAPHLDCHVSGAHGPTGVYRQYQLFYTVYYTKNPT